MRLLISLLYLSILAGSASAAEPGQLHGTWCSSEVTLRFEPDGQMTMIRGGARTESAYEATSDLGNVVGIGWNGERHTGHIGYDSTVLSLYEAGSSEMWAFLERCD